MNKLRIKYIILFFIYVFLLVFFNSCKTITKIEKETEYVHDTITTQLTKRDSIYFQDSIIIKDKGDTVFVDKWHIRYKDKVQYRDSVKIEFKDRIKIEEKKIIEKEKWYKNYWLYSTIGLLMLLILLLKHIRK